MQPTEVDAPFDDPAYRFEPWWPGARVLVAVEGGAVRVQGAHLAEPLVAFPELHALPGRLRSDADVVDGTLMVLDGEGRPDPDLLRERIAFPEVRTGSVALVVCDLVWADGRDLTRRPFRERLLALEALLLEADWCMVGRGYPGEGLTVAAALATLGIASMSARHLAGRYRAGRSEGAWLRVPLEAAAGPARRPTLALIQRLGL